MILFGTTRSTRCAFKRLNLAFFSTDSTTSGYSALPPLTLIGIALRESFRALADPHLGGDSVAAVGEATGEAALVCLYERMRKDSVGRRILAIVSYLRPCTL